jgi:cold shock CspA family protein/DNA-directed RNA polymerase subunit RPC12/RpoP
VANSAFKWFNRASGFELIEPDRGVDSLVVHRASLDESVLATAGERVEFEWREGGMAMNGVASTPEREAVIAAESPRETAELRCGECGYGIVVSGEPPVCPMCRASAWLLPSGDPCIWK